MNDPTTGEDVEVILGALRERDVQVGRHIAISARRGAAFSGAHGCRLALGHHFIQIAQAQIVSQIPSNTQKDDGLIKMAAFEHQTTQRFET